MSTPQKKVEPIPKEYSGVTPYLSVNDAASAIEFYKKGFGATEIMRLPDPSGKIGHAEVKIGKALIMLADENPDYGNLSPKTLGGSAVRLHMYVENVDAFFEKAVAAGAKILIPVADQFYGDRSGRLEDPFGHVWLVSTHTEDVAPEEMQKRMEAYSQQGSD
jgi:PhnB protein